MKDYVLDPKALQSTLEDVKLAYAAKFNKLFVKELLIKLIGGLVREQNQTYFSEEPIESSKLELCHTFQALSSFLKDIFKDVHRDIGLNDERRVFLGLVVFKERLMVYILQRTLEVLRDLIILMPVSSKGSSSGDDDPESLRNLKAFSVTFKEYIDKIIVERKFTARFVGTRGHQHMLLGLAFLEQSLFASLQTSEVRKGPEMQRLSAFATQISQEIVVSRKSFGEESALQRGSSSGVGEYKNRAQQLIK
jgi:hypothetical protein